MKNRLSVGKKARRHAGIALAIGSSLLHTGNSSAQIEDQKQSSPYNIQVVLDGNSNCILRGISISDKPVIQPLLTVNRGAITGSVLGVIDPNNRNANEVDVSIDYTRPLSGRINLSAGYTYTDFRDIKEKTQEAYAGISLNTKLNPNVYLYRDSDLVKGTYGETSVSRNFRRLETRLGLGYNHRYFREGTGISHLNASVNLPLQLSRKTRLTGKLNYVKALNREFKDNTTYGIGVKRDL